MLKASYPLQYIHITGFIIPTAEGKAPVLLAIDNLSERVLHHKIFRAALTTSQIVEFVQEVLSLPDVEKDLSKVTVVTDIKPELEADFRQLLNRPVKLISNHDLNELTIGDIRRKFIEHISQ